MADIKAVRAFRPDKDNVAVVTDLDMDNVNEKIRSGELYQYHRSSFFIYEVSSGNETQIGLIGTASVDDYIEGKIRNHMAIDMEADLEIIEAIEDTGVQEYPVVLTYPDQRYITKLIEIKRKWAGAPLYHFTALNGVTHTIYSMDEGADVANMMDAFAGVPYLYVVEGQEMAASIASLEMFRRENEQEGPAYDRFLTLLLPYEIVKNDRCWLLDEVLDMLFTYKFE